MFKQTLTYTSLDDGKEKTRDFYFNLNKLEITKIHLSLPGGFDGFLQRLEDDPQVEDILNVFEKLILTAYGKRTPEGKFVKSKQLTEEFYASDAFSEMMLKFLDNEDDYANKFLEGTINVPLGDVQKMIEENPDLKAAAEKLDNEF